MNAKQAKYPQLRFNGFTDPWEQRELSDIAEVRTGKAFSSSDFTDDGEFRVVTNKNIQDKTTGKIFTGDRINVSDQTVIDKYVLSGENILVTMDGANIGKVGMYTDSGALLAQRVGRLNSAVLNFVYQIVSDEKFISRMNQLAVGNAIKHISLEQIGRYEIAVPESETEKTKIGQLLSNLDNLIAANQRKLDLLKEQKKGYLQKMFPKNGAKVPELRFAGFADAWEERKLGDVAPLRGGFAFKSSEFRNTGVPIVRISNILSSGEVGGAFAYYDEQDKDDKYILPDKSAVLAMSGATTGKVSILSQTSHDKVYQNQRVGYFQSVDCIDYDFISTIVRSELFMMQLESVLVSGAQPNVSSKEIDSFDFMIPKLVQEQQKIGSFFKQLDNTIALHQRKLEKLQELKKGYLQKMFC